MLWGILRNFLTDQLGQPAYWWDSDSVLPASLSSATKASQKRTPVAMAASCPGTVKEVPSQQDEANWHHAGRAAGGRHQVLRKVGGWRAGLPSISLTQSQGIDKTCIAQPRPSNLRPDSRFGYLQWHTLYLQGFTRKSHRSVPLRTPCKHIVKEFLKGFMRDST